MKTKRKTPVFSVIVLRVLEARFKEIVQVRMVSDTVFELCLKSGIKITDFMTGFDRHMVHVVAEFGDPERCYLFRFSSGVLSGELCYGNLNNDKEINVTLNTQQRYGN